MSPPDGIVPGTPQDWLRHAASDLAVADELASPTILFETLCYHAQQAAEKSIKAVLIHHGAAFPYTHNLARLITVLREAAIDWPADLDEAAELTEYAVELRYPAVSRQVDAADLRSAVEIAKRVFEWAENALSSSQI